MIMCRRSFRCSSACDKHIHTAAAWADIDSDPLSYRVCAIAAHLTAYPCIRRRRALEQPGCCTLFAVAMHTHDGQYMRCRHPDAYLQHVGGLQVEMVKLWLSRVWCGVLIEWSAPRMVMDRIRRRRRLVIMFGFIYLAILVPSSTIHVASRVFLVVFWYHNKYFII